MPVQKGKKRRRTRRHSQRDNGFESEESSVTTETPPARPRVKWRRGYQPPPIVNLGLGVIMLLAGVIFFVVGAGGGQGSYRFVLLFLYLLIAAFYLSKAARQYRAKRQA